MSAKPLPATQKVEKIKERKRRLPLTGDGANTERGKTKREEMGGGVTAVKAFFFTRSFFLLKKKASAALITNYVTGLNKTYKIFR